MRVTLAGAPGPPRVPDLDLEVPDGARLGDLRGHLASATGRAELAPGGAVLAVGAAVLDDDQLTGQVPLLAGATLRVGAGPRDPGDAALRAEWHLAVLSGPDSGALVGLRGPLVVGRVGDLAIDDGRSSRRHLALRLGRSGPMALDLRSSHGTVRLPARMRWLGWLGWRAESGWRWWRGRRVRGRPATPVRRAGPAARWTRLHVGDRLLIGSTVLELRAARATVVRSSADRTTGDRTTGDRTTGDRTAGDRTAGDRAPEGRARGELAATTWLAPAAGSVALALSTGNRMFLIVAAVGPLLAIASRLRARAHTARGRAPAAGPARRTSPGRLDGPGPEPPSPADLSTRALRLLAGAEPTDAPGPADVRALSPDGALAVVGPRGLAVAAARALVAAALPLGPTDADVAVAVRADPAHLADWSWCRWLPGLAPAHAPAAAPAPSGAAGVSAADATGPTGPTDPAGPTTLVVGDGWHTPGQATDLARFWAGGHGAAVVLIAADLVDVPAWCRTVLTVHPGKDVATLHLPTGATRTLPLHAVSHSWAEVHARRVAALWQLRRLRDLPPGASPNAAGGVALADLPGLPAPSAASVIDRWAQGHAARAGGLDACLGLGPAGAPVTIDLIRDGPHALVAGTTGAGKSELLQTWLLSLALTHSPAELAFALVDYKGGASFGPCAELPHVVGQVTDLDPALAARALAGLRAELRRRERLLARAGVPDLAALRSAPPPRLLVVVDEFRALTEDLPSFVPGLLRLAAQGRSLGMHLILATQRPAGAVGPDLRANLTLRIALRVTDVADSLDVLDSPEAARIPASSPGRAVLRRGTGAPEPVQIALANGAPLGPRGAVRIAPPWPGTPTGWVPAASAPPAGRHPCARPGPDSDAGESADPRPARAFVAAARAAAAQLGLDAPAAPWLPPLPDLLRPDDLAAHAAAEHGLGAQAGRGDADAGRLPLALADVPTQRRRAVVRWGLAAGPLLVVGAAGSGRSTTLRTAALAALARGWHVHAVGVPARLIADLTARPTFGTAVGVDDPRRLARLLLLLAQPAPAGAAPRLLLLDEIEAALDALAPLGRGSGAARLIDLLRRAREHGTAVLATGSAAPPGAVATLFPQRLVLAVGDRAADVVAGVPGALAGSRRGPGRAIVLPSVAGSLVEEGTDEPDAIGEPGDALVCQVAADGVADGSPPDDTAPESLALRLAPVPARVGRGALATAVRRERGPSPRPDEAPVVGIGGDDAGPVRLALGRGALVVGPPGSGRSTTLAVLAAALAAAGRPIVVVARDGPLERYAAAHPAVAWCGFASAAIARLLAAAPPGAVALVDDLDALERLHPGVTDLLGALAQRSAEPAGSGPGPEPGPGPGPGPIVVAAAQTGRAAISYRGALGALRDQRVGIVLTPTEPGSADVFGTALDWVVEPGHAHTPGRAVRQHGRDVVVVQVLDPTLA
ncbi:FHA domain-containing protein [Pengzhenrongella sicca]|uniref:FtsK domain-containing protein n=1 Tax=Pengzhenrongella sicca TaxID=2819238 RepID=A0A8A4ZG08_9MICO|nr:FHA domain-containing protein [Pengzhenrongella sicca]QTE30215.1 hypothetical protein J4E96_04180 [Pengzhenrongella sicca]